MYVYVYIYIYVYGLQCMSYRDVGDPARGELYVRLQNWDSYTFSFVWGASDPTTHEPEGRLFEQVVPSNGTSAVDLLGKWCNITFETEPL